VARPKGGSIRELPTSQGWDRTGWWTAATVT